ncbi:MAG: DUF1295 domain-containing protein [Armatimonadetes bacterium]|nr:DUF1295 domain-containing protein [Armatimonadota bacterium]
MLIISALIAMIALMVALWYVQYKRHNAGIVDVAWSFGTGLCAVWFCIGSSGDANRRIVVALLMGIWAIRLGSTLAVRVFSEAEDGRYKMLREKWGDRTQALMFGFYMIQASWAVLFALPAYAAAQNSSPFGIADFVGIMIWAIALAGEGVADAQLARFRKNPANKGRVCEDGLWAWSRHPNYFFEWIHWFAYPLLALGGPSLSLAMLGPVVMLIFLTKISGIPLTEARSILSRGDIYRDYQRRVSAFFPVPPRRERDS